MKRYATPPKKPCPYCQNQMFGHWRFCERPQCIQRHRKKKEAEKEERKKLLTNQVEQ